VAIVGGGITLFEACAIGVPSVAFAVASAQTRTILCAAARGAVIDGGAVPLSDLAVQCLVNATVRLLRDGGARRRTSALARSLVDGRGAWRVASMIQRLSDRVRRAA